MQLCNCAINLTFCRTALALSSPQSICARFYNVRIFSRKQQMLQRITCQYITRILHPSIARTNVCMQLVTKQRIWSAWRRGWW